MLKKLLSNKIYKDGLISVFFFGNSIKSCKKICRLNKKHYFCITIEKSGGSLAQLVEHIPFKDGVLGSSPKRATCNIFWGDERFSK